MMAVEGYDCPEGSAREDTTCYAAREPPASGSSPTDHPREWLGRYGRLKSVAATDDCHFEVQAGKLRMAAGVYQFLCCLVGGANGDQLGADLVTLTEVGT